MNIKFQIGDVIRRKPLAQYNYDRPVMKIADIKGSLYIFETDGPIPKALEIVAQDEWELYSTNSVKKFWEAVVGFFKKLFRIQQPVKVDLKHIGRQKRIAGHRLYMYNLVTGEVKEAPVKYGKCITEPDCVYRQALNKKNFIKKLKREGIIKKEDKV